MSSWLDTKEMSVMTGAQLSSQLWYNIVIPRLEAEAQATPVTCELGHRTQNQMTKRLRNWDYFWWLELDIEQHIFCIFIYLLSFTNTIEQVYHPVAIKLSSAWSHTSECSVRCGVHSLSTDWVLMFAKSWHKSRDSWPRLCRADQGSKPRPVWLVRSDDDSWPDPSGPRVSLLAYEPRIPGTSQRWCHAQTRIRHNGYYDNVWLFVLILDGQLFNTRITPRWQYKVF